MDYTCQLRHVSHWLGEDVTNSLSAAGGAMAGKKTPALPRTSQLTVVHSGRHAVGLAHL